MHDRLRELQDILHREIPITRHFNLTVGSYDERCLRLDAPLSSNINHSGTAFGGSLSSLLTLAGWGVVWLVLQEYQLDGEIVIQDSSCNFLHPVTHDFSACCYRPAPEQLAKFAHALRTRSRARLELEADISNEERVAVTFRARYVVTRQ